MRSSLRFGVMAAVLFSGMALPGVADASPIQYKIGTFEFVPEYVDPDVGFTIPAYGVLSNLTPCPDPTDPFCLPAALRDKSFEAVSFWHDDHLDLTSVDLVASSVDYVNFDPSTALGLFVSLSFLNSPFPGPFTLDVNATGPTDIFFTYDDAVQTPVPEPGSLLLLGTGVGALAYGVRRKRRRASFS